MNELTTMIMVENEKTGEVVVIEESFGVRITEIVNSIKTV